MLPGNLTLCRSLSTRRPFAGFRANLETHFLFWGRCCAPRVLLCSYSICRRLGRVRPLAQSAHQYSGQQQQRRLCRAATALTRPRPAKCENLCSTASASRTETRTRFHHDQRENGAPAPHTTEHTVGPQTIVNMSQRQRESTAVNLGPRTRPQPHREDKRRDRQGNSARLQTKIENKHC